MKKFFRKLIPFVVTVPMILSMGGCSQQIAPVANDTSNTNNTTQETTGEQQVTLTMWSIATESDGLNPAFKKAIADYELAHPNVKIVHETFENESYKTKLKSAVAANELPDIFFTWGGGFAEPFVASGKVLALDNYFVDEYKAQLPEAALANATYNGKLYGSTYTTPVSALFYNKKMFEERGLIAPTSWDELVKVCEAFLEDDITPLCVSVKDTWALAMYHDAFTLKAAGPEKTMKAITGQGVSYNDADFLDSATKLKALVDMGAFISGATGVSNDEASAQFYNGTVPMYITGSWASGLIYTESQTPEDFSVAPVPVMNSNNAKITQFMGGAADTLMVADATKYPEIAGNAAFELCRSISKYAYLDGAAIAAWEIDYDDSALNPITQQLAAFAGNATSFTLWFDTLMTAEDAGEYLALLQELYMGNITPQEFVQSMATQLDQ